MELTDRIIEEIYKETDQMLNSLARNTKIPGYDTDDLVQEMRIIIWEVIRDDKYDPERCKETSFFYKVCKRHLRGLNRSKIYRYNESLPENREYRDALDQKPTFFDEKIHEKAEIPPSFVENFSEKFKSEFF
jgi:hypothetical protein